ncbi:MAG: hypothetical protein Q7T21_10745 [Gallionella sp.]|nr:hypothetical protein [Gallionella sp.]
MRLIITLVCAAVMATSNFALAQKSNKQPRNVQWKSEPSSVFGIKLGETLIGDAVPPCGGFKGKDVDPEITVCAMYRPSSSGISIAGFPVSEFQSGNVLLRDDIATSILIEARHNDYGSVKRLLVERYGEPTTSKNQVIQNNLGASFSSEKHIWLGKNITLTLDERAGRVDQTTIFFSHIKSAEKYEQEAEKKRKAGAAKM